MPGTELNNHQPDLLAPAAPAQAVHSLPGEIAGGAVPVAGVDLAQLAVIIPVFNERDAIRRTIEELRVWCGADEPPCALPRAGSSPGTTVIASIVAKISWASPFRVIAGGLMLRLSGERATAAPIPWARTRLGGPKDCTRRSHPACSFTPSPPMP